MKILWLCPFVPYPLDNGGNIRVFSMLSHLSKIHEIHLICLNSAMQGGMKLDPLKKLCKKVDVLDSPPFLPLKLHHAPYFFSSTPGSIAVDGAKLRREVEFIVSSQTFDLLHVEFLTLAELALSLNIKMRTCTEHFFAMESYNHNLQDYHGLKHWYFSRELRKMKRWEPTILAKFDHVFVTSKTHQQHVTQWMNRENRATLVPNGVDTNYFRPQSCEVNPHSFFFMGAFHLDPSSQRALAVLVDEVFPTVLKMLPNAELHVVGKGASLEVVERAHPNIHFHGYVDDVRPYLASSAALLLPIVGGSGTKLRILTAMSMAKPVVTSIDGLAGLQCEDGKELCVARDWKEMASKAVQLSLNEDLRKNIGLSARKVVEERFSWEYLASIQNAAWMRMN